MKDQVAVHFIVGFPRSGTKLLRDVLSKHPQIGVNKYESNFLLDNGLTSELNGKQDLNRITKILKSNTIYENDSILREELNTGDWINDLNADKITIEDIYLRLFNRSLQKGIFFDKSPSYTTKIDYIQGLFPKAKFIHIYRDVRDIALSTSMTWRRSMVRASNQWNKTLNKVYQSNAHKNRAILWVSYEKLLTQPSAVLKEICYFMNVSDTGIDKMISGDYSKTEKYGEAKDSNRIMQDNYEKYLAIPEKKLKRVEEISFLNLQKLNYQINLAKRPKALSKFEQYWLKVYDYYYTLLFHIKDKGFVKGFRYFFKLQF